MVINHIEREWITEINSQNGSGELNLDRLLVDGAFQNIKTFAHAVLEPGASVGFHIHNGEGEIYYFLSGTGCYDDNGEKILVTKGDVTVTRSGEGHGIENVGEIPLEFIALIVLE